MKEELNSCCIITGLINNNCCGNLIIFNLVLFISFFWKSITYPAWLLFGRCLQNYDPLINWALTSFNTNWGNYYCEEKFVHAQLTANHVICDLNKPVTFESPLTTSTRSKRAQTCIISPPRFFSGKHILGRGGKLGISGFRSTSDFRPNYQEMYIQANLF